MNFHIPETQSQVLAGKVGLVTGIASDESIVIGCARALRDVGAAAYTGSRSKNQAVAAGTVGRDPHLPLRRFDQPVLAIAIALSSAATEFGRPLGGQGVH